jgi:hypothetical protein
MKTEQVGTSAVPSLDKASVSTRQFIIMDTNEWQQRESFFFYLSLKTSYDLMACNFI